MFDDIDNTPKTSATPPTPPIQPAPPTHEPRPRPIQPMPPSNLPIEDIFSPADGISLRDDPTDTIPVVTPLGGMPKAPIITPPPPLQEQSRSGFRKALVFFLSALIVAFLGIGAYLVYRILKTQNDNDVDILNQPIESGIEPQEQGEDKAPEEEVSEENAINEEENVEEPEKDGSAENQTPPPPSDTDNDGLNDLEELELGSNPRIIDTDIDGLDDYSEARVYRSNPVLRDTDGDSYDDGLEVQNGYSPTGPGRLTSE